MVVILVLAAAIAASAAGIGPELLAVRRPECPPQGRATEPRDQADTTGRERPADGQWPLARIIVNDSSNDSPWRFRLQRSSGDEGR